MKPGDKGYIDEEGMEFYKCTRCGNFVPATEISWENKVDENGNNLPDLEMGGICDTCDEKEENEGKPPIGVKWE